MEKGNRRTMTKKQGNATILAVLAFFIIVLTIVVSMSIKNTMDLRNILKDSVKSQLISIATAAREMLDVDAFISYNDASVADDPHYKETLAKLRNLNEKVGSQYIYALKYVDGVCMFVFDTDPEDEEIFIEYNLAPVHKRAFEGESNADVMNVEDEYGTFNTGAVPIMKDGEVVGVISADTEDKYLQQSLIMAVINSVILVLSLIITMGVMFNALIRLITSVQKMHSRLEYIAHHDTITGLPNRQYLLSVLEKATSTSEKFPFALLFIDLDNFKKVNDSEGHDAGDKLLRAIAQYLDRALEEDSEAFRPDPGKINIAARIGGDEFIQVIRNVDTEEKASAIAQKLLDGFNCQEFDYYIKEYGVGMSIGIALYPSQGEDYNILIKCADIAMYHAKIEGKNRYRIYNDKMNWDDIDQEIYRR